MKQAGTPRFAHRAFTLNLSLAYLALGHLAQDLTPAGPRLGGTVAYATLTAWALGYPPGIVSAHRADLDVSALGSVTIYRNLSDVNTTFENLYSEAGRVQFLRARAKPISLAQLPPAGVNAPIIHIAPLAQEIETSAIQQLAASTSAFIGLTPQGWLRQWDAEGRVSQCAWPEALTTLPVVNATVISIEDVRGEWAMAEQWAKAARVLAVTEGAQGCTVYVQGEGARKFSAPAQPEVDPTGAGDVFAAAFFISYYETNDPWASARFANQVAALSITRVGLDGIPTLEEIGLCRIMANEPCGR